MKKLMLATLLFASTAMFAATTVTGVLTDSMCTRKHMMSGKTNAECVRECVKEGAKFVVLANGKSVELKGHEDKLNALAGKTIKVTGEMKGAVLVVSSVEAAN
ncbi:MAG: hypothetical protein P4M01_05630 [Acidobacteriota bacterium]|nr:hypothetical protein [Acidobacteriota bacterium]